MLPLTKHVLAPHLSQEAALQAEKDALASQLAAANELVGFAVKAAKSLLACPPSLQPC